jgi:hypothetical protein
MNLTVKTIATWASATDLSNQAVLADLQNTLGQMIDSGKTDGTPIQVSATVWQRNWADQAAAEEWKAAITALAVQHGVVLNSVTISPLSPIIEGSPVVV